MRHGSLFSGIGGFDLAAQWMGWENVFHCEIDPFCQKVLEKNFPGVPRYGDIKQFDGTKYRGAVDIITGGFPCQPFSTAGKRKGAKDDRYLWPEMLRIIREVQPAYIVGENVSGIVNWSRGLVFEQVCADLENEGYQVQPVILPACAVNAPHRRDRVWFVAYSKGNHDRRTQRELCKTNGRPVGKLLSTSGGAGEGLRGEGVVANTGSQLCQSYSNDRKQQGIEQIAGWQKVRHNSPAVGASGPLANTDSSKRREGGGNEEESKTPERHVGTLNTRDDRGGWQNFPTQPPLRDGNDGLPSRLVRSAIQAGGNAIVPQVAFEIFKAIEKVISI